MLIRTAAFRRRRSQTLKLGFLALAAAIVFTPKMTDFSLSDISIPNPLVTSVQASEAP